MSTTLYILPSAAAADAVIHQMATESRVVFGIAALTLRKLTEAVLASAEDVSPLISAGGRRLLLQELVEDKYSSGSGTLGRVCRFPGFTASLDRLFGEFKHSGVSPSVFLSTTNRMGGNSRLSEIADLYAAYERTLASHRLMDQHDLEYAALRHLKKGGPLPPLFDNVSTVCCRGIYDLSPLQLALLAEISRVVPVELELPWHPEREVLYSCVSRTADALEALDNARLSLEPVFSEPEGAFLTPLRTAVFGLAGDGKAEPPHGMALVAAPGQYAECEEIGRRIRVLLESGCEPAAIGVAFRDLTHYRSMMEDVCRRYRIPVSYRRGAPLFTSPLVGACLSPFDVVSSRFAREELLTLIKSSYCKFPLGVSPDAVEEVLVAAGYIDESVAPIEVVVEKRLATHGALSKSNGIEAKVVRFLGILLRELRQFQGKKTLAEFNRLLELFIERHCIYSSGIAAGDPRALKRDASAIILFRRVLNDLERDVRMLGLGERLLDPHEAAALLKLGMEGSFLAGEVGTGVAIVNFHDARGLRYDHLFIGGLNEGVCPARHAEHPLFKDSEKIIFNRLCGHRQFRPASAKEEEENLLFFLAIGCAGQSLTLSYNYVNRRGDTLLRSPYLEELMAKVAVEEIRIPVNRITCTPEQCLEPEEYLNALAAAHCFSSGPNAPDSIRQSLTRIYGNHRMENLRESFLQLEAAAERAALANRYTGRLSRVDILEDLHRFYGSSDGSRFSPTTLEEYGGCPFKYFTRRVLQVSASQKPDVELSPMEEGSLVHDLLCSIFRRLQEAGLLPLREVVSVQALVSEESAAVFERWEQERVCGQTLLWEAQKRRLTIMLKRLVEREAEDFSNFLPSLFEYGFDGFPVDDDDGSRIFLHGKIDRVDVTTDPAAIRVVDYKLAANSARYRSLLKKENLGVTSFQVPVYLLAAARTLREELELATDRFCASYWLLRALTRVDADFNEGKDNFVGFFATTPEVRRGLGEGNFLNRLCAMVRRMKDGDFSITPDECGYCDFGTTCRYVPVEVGEE